MIPLRLLCQVSLVALQAFTAHAVSAATCEDMEWWFEVGVGFYSNGYSLEGTEKRTRKLYRSTRGEALMEDEAVALTLDAWRFLDEGDVSTDIGQIERLLLADQFYARCIETTAEAGQEESGE